VADIVSARLRAQRLVGPGFTSPVDVVRHFGAVQSQDYPAAKWALGLRMRSAVESEVDRAYDAGAIVRTHVLRPTWHFVAPEDLRWMLALTGPKIHRGMAGRHRQLELDARTIVRAHRVFEKALEGGHEMTRPELGAALSRAGIAPDGQRLPHLLFSGELTALLISGRRKRGQHTYMLLEERVPQAPALEREEAIARLVQRYFVSHGPAQLRDFVWWSGLTQVEAKRGIESAGDSLDRVEMDGMAYWFDPAVGGARRGAATAALLPNFDEYTVGYADRSAILHPARPFRPELFAFSSILSNVVVIAGQVCGAWRRQAGRDALRIEVRQLAGLSAGERALVEAAGGRLSRFLGRPVAVVWL
jgi:Winged helix DNA-binding domain